MTTNETKDAIGREGLLTEGSFTFAVRVLDARGSFGRTDFKVRSTSGGGERWVNADRVSLTDNPTENRGADAIAQAPSKEPSV